MLILVHFNCFKLKQCMRLAATTSDSLVVEAGDGV